MKTIVLWLTVVVMTTAAWAETGLSLPEGTALKLKLENTLTSSTSRNGDPFSGRITEPVVVDGRTVIPIGATVQGRLTRVSEPRRIAGRPTIAIYPELLVLPNGERFALNANLVDTNRGGRTDVNEEGEFKGPGHDGRDTTEIALGTGGGMLAGGLIGGGKGVVIGGAIGATATVAHWLSKRNSAYLPAGTELVMELSRPLAMTTSSGGE